MKITDPTYRHVVTRLFGNADQIAEMDDPHRVRAFSNGSLEIDGVVFGRRDGRRDSGYSSPWAELTGGDAD